MKKLPKITIRFLPVVAFLAAVSLCVKLTNENFTFKPIGIAIAQDEDGTSKDTEKSDAKESGEATLQEALDEDSESLDGPKKPIFTAAELDILENLSERRKSLDARSSELDIRENLLVATQKSVEEKINELKKIEVTIRNLLGQHDKQEKLRMRGGTPKPISTPKVCAEPPSQCPKWWHGDLFDDKRTDLGFRARLAHP